MDNLILIIIDRLSYKQIRFDAAGDDINPTINNFAKSGKVSLYEFVIEMANLTNKQIEVSRAKDSDFPSLAHKPLRAALVSEKLPPLRRWKQALAEYVDQLS